LLRTKDGKIVDSAGQAVHLRGTCVGGWMNMENFINGYPGSESGIRAVFASELGESKAKFFFDRLLDYFLSEQDIAFQNECGATVVRLPLNYRHFEEDGRPFEYREDGFKRLNQVIEWCEIHGLYVILDMHAAQGCQNCSWHCDNANRRTMLWTHRQFRDRLVELWKEFARRYRGKSIIAGYNLINEPCTGAPFGRLRIQGNPEWDAINSLYRRLVQEIRTIDEEHIIFLEGDRYSRLFSGLEEPFAPNLVYSSHNYTDAGFGPGSYPGKIAGQHWDEEKQEREFAEQEGTIFSRKHEVPLWIGEFGSVFNGAPSEIPDRLRALDDQLSVFARFGAHWTTWTYKDVGVMGWVTVDPDSEYMERIAPILKAKQELFTDFWMKWLPATKAKQMVADLAGHLHGFVDGRDQERQDVERFLIQTALSGYAGNLLQPGMACIFKDISEQRIDAILSAFAFDKCVRNEGLLSVIGKHLQGGES